MHAMKRRIALALIFILLLPLQALAAGNNTLFSDVPVTHFAYKAINDMRSLGITDGVGNNKFGMGRTITRGEFITFLIKLTGWERVSPDKGSFPDDQDKNRFYYPMIETALLHGVIVKDSDLFRVDDPITREEMAVMIVRALGYDSLAKQVAYLNPFTDVTAYQGYIAIARDFGIMSGSGKTTFSPGRTATREEAAYMLMKMYERLNRSIGEVHAFYAISSYSQADMISALGSVSFGWSRLEYDAGSNAVILNTSRNNGNEYGFPQGFSDPLGRAQAKGIPTQLMIAVKDEAVTDPATGNQTPLAEYIINSPEVRTQVVDNIAKQINSSVVDGLTVSFSGVVIDFEGLKGEADKLAFNAFLAELKQALVKNNKTLTVAVQPARRPGQAYFDGYDFRTVGDIADKVILMAHDYYARTLTDSEMRTGYTTTPLTPIDEVYYALKAITDKDTGVKDAGKVLLQISFDTVQWEKSGGAVVNRAPGHPDYASLQSKLAMEGTTVNYSNINQNPYATYTDPVSGNAGIIWYEDSRSVAAKMKLAEMFGIKGLSLWRLGNIPNFSDSGKALYLDVWNQILQAAGKSMQ